MSKAQFPVPVPRTSSQFEDIFFELIRIEYIATGFARKIFPQKFFEHFSKRLSSKQFSRKPPRPLLSLDLISYPIVFVRIFFNPFHPESWELVLLGSNLVTIQSRSSSRVKFFLLVNLYIRKSMAKTLALCDLNPTELP